MNEIEEMKKLKKLLWRQVVVMATVGWFSHEKMSAQFPRWRETVEVNERRDNWNVKQLICILNGGKVRGQQKERNWFFFGDIFLAAV